MYQKESKTQLFKSQEVFKIRANKGDKTNKKNLTFLFRRSTKRKTKSKALLPVS